MATIKDKLDAYFEETILNERIEDIVGERFGRYSKYIIQDRALPDVRDGLKPVQRRILFAMYKLGMFADKPYKKSARIAGEVMGKYHPHGDSSIYEAMVRMSQYWKMRMPLIDMHGNNGSIDGDSAAAMRYTEARLSKQAEMVLKDIDKRTVPFVPNFDDEELEPTVLPAKIPNLLVNGATGISAGYATKIPPHNLREVIKATIERIDRPEMTVDDLAKILLGPDFPTGGIVQGREGIKNALATGAGRIIIRSKTDFEEMNKQQTRIIVSEIPYDINKAEVVKAIDNIRLDKKIDDILEVRDESDREGLRIAIDLKKGANPEFVLNYLLKNTDLQIAYNYNMVAIYNHRPVQMGVLSILDAYINHQKEVIMNRSNFELTRAQKRLHIVEGLMKMVSIIEEVIQAIRASKNKANAKELISQAFGFSEEQAEAIVTLQLYRLSSTDIEELRKEHASLEALILKLKAILSNEKELLNVIKMELKEVAQLLGDKRKTVIEEEIETIKIAESELVNDERVMIAVTKEGYVKRSNLRSFAGSKIMGIKESDSLLYKDEVSTLNTLLLFTNLGNYIYLPVYKIEDQKWRDLGTFIHNIVPIEPNESIIDVTVVENFDTEDALLFVTKNGLIKQTLLKDLNVSRYNKTIKCMKMNVDDLLVSVDRTDQPKEVLVFTKKGFGLRYPASEISFYGTSAGGVKAISLSNKDEVSVAIYTKRNHDFLLLTSRGNIRRSKVEELPMSHRGKPGVSLIKEIKARPHLITSAVTMSENQYKESVVVDIMTAKDNVTIQAFDLKYLSNDNGKNVVSELKFGHAIKLSIAPSVLDEVDEDYDPSSLIKTREVKAKPVSLTVESHEEEHKQEHIQKLSLFDDVDNE